MGRHVPAFDPSALMPALPERARDEEFAAIAPALPRTLEELALLVRRDLDLTRYPAKTWVLPRQAPNATTALDALVVGGGQAGVAAAFGLLQQRVTNMLVIDENTRGQEGPWNTYARMPTLRTQKDVGGIELGIANASFRAWFEVQHGGRQAWQDLYKIPTNLWHDYLQWFRDVLDIPFRNQCRLVRFESAANGLVRVEIDDNGLRDVLWTRTLIFATGIEGNGVRHAPAFVTDHLPRERWAHTHDPIDFAALRDKRVAVLGGAASAFDAAILAAEAGAQSVHLHHRAPVVQAANPMAWGEFNGYLAHFADLPLADRWRFSRQIKRLKTGPPQATIARALAAQNLTIHSGSAWNTVAMVDGAVHVSATGGTFDADFVILGTGYLTDISVKPEFAEHLDVFARWADVFEPPPGEEDASQSGAAYLGPNFEMTEKTPGTAPWLGAIFNFSRGAQMSMGAMPIGLSGIKFGVPRLVHGVTKRLFTEDADRYFHGLNAWQESGDISER